VRDGHVPSPTCQYTDPFLVHACPEGKDLLKVYGGQVLFRVNDLIGFDTEDGKEGFAFKESLRSVIFIA